MIDLNLNLKQFLKINPEEVQKKMDKALGRTKIFEAQNKKTPSLKNKN